MRGRARAVAGLLASLVALTACAATSAPPPAASPTALPPPPTASSPTPAPAAPTVGAARGATAFQAWCNSCHPGGQAANGPALWGRGITLTPAEIRARIRHGSDPRERQRFAQLSDARLDEIIDYIRAQQRASGP